MTDIRMSDLLVVYKDEGVPDYAVGQFLQQELADRDAWVSETHELTHKYEVVNNYNTPDDKLLSVLACVDDHINNIANDDLEVEFVDQFCTHKPHVDNEVECHGGLDSCEVVDVYESSYVADRTTVQLIYIRLA